MKILDVPQSGSLAGQTSSRNRFGQYRRTRAIPVNPNTTRQSQARSVLTELAQAWAGLTDNQREEWNLAGALITRTDSLGQTYNLTGMQHYVSVNAVLNAIGGTPVSVPPAGPEPDAPTVNVADSTISGLEVEVSGTGTNRYALFSSPPQSPGRSFCKDFRLIATGALVAGAATVAVAAFEAKFGSLPVDRKLFLKAYQVLTDGSVSPVGVTSTVLST